MSDRQGVLQISDVSTGDSHPTVLVTGASGFVGGEIALELDRSGYKVSAMVRPGSDLSRLAGRDITVVEGDIRNADDVARAMEGQDFVCHAAALVPGSGGSDDEYQAVNVGGTRTVCDRAIAGGISRLLYLSTTHVFGIHPGLRADETSTSTSPPNAGYDESLAGRSPPSSSEPMPGSPSSEFCLQSSTSYAVMNSDT